MSREEYLNQLHKYLRKLPRQDYEDAMEYFTEYFQETDEEEAAELMKELGTPKEAARELMANLLDKKIEDHQSYEADGQTRAEQFYLRQLWSFFAVRLLPVVYWLFHSLWAASQ